MKISKIILLILLIVFVGIQFIPTKRNLSEIVPNTDFMIVNNVPNSIKNTLQTSCYDCHSNNTYYPWYNKVQPVAWILESHIEEGKAELNFSDWNTYSNRRKKSKLKSIVSQIEDDKMPLISYTLIHKDAVLTQKQKTEIIDWITKLQMENE
ncbi:heme-binding domain-containing protein [Flavobacterium cyclinae]|uniref:heme-binding domain-containing protein n=1 Tax=Flavobacterium cyclinae TaxID=2895947 RepID=UPI001E5FFE68|nr:heme-binding domain-containing protein [Flavobacterium cyclinae]UGS19850.1 heme-binding domain-containing protein [Flavobacterium cyclinae]